jgi:hypothetical protein
MGRKRGDQQEVADLLFDHIDSEWGLLLSNDLGKLVFQFNIVTKH